MLFGKTRAGYIPLIDHDAEPPMPLLIPAATAESHLRNVLQAVQEVLDLAEGPEAVPPCTSS